ncbi:MAG: efflux RND transporter periplasmic adaptor subunit [Planctomycetes bacterium]|nr:efflux RND transporter periplasmic adaptor subunit [Planctomycetota bacterium]
MNRRSVIAGTLVLLALGGIAGGLAWWKIRKMSAPPPPAFEMAESVEVVPVRSTSWYPTAKLVGSVFAIQSITLSNEVAGTIKQVLFESGSIVEQGQVLLTMDTSTEDADLAAAEANVKVTAAGIDEQLARLAAAKATVVLAQSDLQRIDVAVDARAASESARDRARADLQKAQADVAQYEAAVIRATSEVDQAKARVAQLKALIGKKTLKAPFRSRVGIRTVHPGQYLAEGTTMVWLQGVDEKAYLDFAIPQDQVMRVSVGQVVMARSAAFGPDPTPIKVVAIDAGVDRATRNVRIRSLVDNPGERLRPGTFVDVEVPIDAPADFLVVPDTAVRRASYGDHIFVITPGEKPGELRAHQRFVKTGATLGREVILLDGIKPGEQVAGDGSFKLRDGALVAPKAPPPAKQADASAPK